MLIKVDFSEDKIPFRTEDDSKDFLKKVISFIQEVEAGIYITPLNMEHILPHISDWEITDNFGSFSGGMDATLEDYRRLILSGYEIRNNYGVCDTFEQILEEYPELKNDARKFFVSMTPIVKEEEPEQGGWHWHKWGGYIGEQKPMCEYIYDEPEIEEVFVYHIYEIEKKEG